jgi:hypothetical protein
MAMRSAPLFLRHPELVSGSTVQQGQSQVAWWMLKQVQHDEMRGSNPSVSADAVENDA